MELEDEIQQMKEELTTSIRVLRKHGIRLAEAEKNYKLTLTTEALKLRQEGVAVTLIDMIIHGMPNVAELRFKRDVAKTMYDANLEHINVSKLKLRLLENQLSREYGYTGGNL